MDRAATDRPSLRALAAVDGSYSLVSWTGGTPDQWVPDIIVLRTRMSTDAPYAGLDVDEEPWDAARIAQRRPGVVGRWADQDDGGGTGRPNRAAGGFQRDSASRPIAPGPPSSATPWCCPNTAATGWGCCSNSRTWSSCMRCRPAAADGHHVQRRGEPAHAGRQRGHSDSGRSAAPAAGARSVTRAGRFVDERNSCGNAT